MSASSTFFAIYLAVGLLLMVVALAVPGRERRTKGFVGGWGPDVLSAALLFFIAVLWPLWLVWWLVKQDDRER